jgi:ABC-type amino acid transport system permease subunit
MTRILTIAASLGLAMSTAGACEMMRSASAGIDETTVASTTATPMSTPETADPVVKPEADSEG